MQNTYMKLPKFYTCCLSLSMAVALSLSSCCGGNVNSNDDSHFDENGYSLRDSTEAEFTLRRPDKIKFFIEVSGSMNGFFRANKVTNFKTDVWEILNRYNSTDVTVLTNSGNAGETLSLSSFQSTMNTGGFVSTASTQVPTMLETILSDLNTDKGEVAVLISDMKYSPVGSAAPDVLLAQYSTDISKILNTYKKSVSLIGATSDYLDKTGDTIAEKSPYYFLIIGNAEQVASVRNDISSLLEMSGHFIDNIESGFDYGRASCSFGIPKNCCQLDNEPTFVGFDGDTCTIQMKVALENYRWIMADTLTFAKALSIKGLNGSNFSVDIVGFDVQNTTKKEGKKELIRKATAIINLKVYDMAMDSEVIEWGLNLPESDYTKFAEYFDDSKGENDVTKSYSLSSFVKGMFFNSYISRDLRPNYILISRNE